jgi:mRNA interferase RelE/StbE
VLKVVYSKSAANALKRMAANRSATIRTKVEQCATEPVAQSANVRKLKGEQGYRLRVGDYRVIFEIEDDTLTVIAVGPRGGVY